MNSIWAEWWVVLTVLFGRHTPADLRVSAANGYDEDPQELLEAFREQMGGGSLRYEFWGLGHRQTGAAGCRKKEKRRWGAGLLPCESLGNLKGRRSIRCRAYGILSYPR